MKLVLILAFVLTTGGSCIRTQAAVPVNDASILSRRSETAARTVDIRTRLGGIQSSRQGIDCAVRTPRKAGEVKPASRPADPDSGRAALERANPDIDTSPAFPPSAGTGAGAAQRTLLEGTGKVVGAMVASQGAVSPGRQAFQAMGREVGSDGTAMEAFDRNSAVRLQGGLTFNEVIQAASLFAQALNLDNLNTATLVSRGSAGLVVASPPPPGGPAAVCPAGTSGGGTAASPCISEGCSTTGYGSVPAPGCVRRRYTDSAGNLSLIHI